MARTSVTRYSVGSIREPGGSVAPGPPLGQSGRAPRGRGDAGIEPHFGECLTPTPAAVAETQGSAAVRAPQGRRVSARPAPEKRDGCEAPRRAGVPAPSPAPILGGWRADDGRASSPVLGNTARAGGGGFSLRSLDREHRHSVNSVVRGVAAPAVCATGANGIRGRVRKDGNDRVPLLREGRHDGAGRRPFAASAPQSATKGRHWARSLRELSHRPGGVARGAMCRERVFGSSLGDGSGRFRVAKSPAAHRRLGRAVFSTLHLEGRIGAAGGANSRSPWGSCPGRRSSQIARRAVSPASAGEDDSVCPLRRRRGRGGGAEAGCCSSHSRNAAQCRQSS